MNKRNKLFTVRVNKEELEIIMKISKFKGFDSASGYVRHLLKEENYLLKDSFLNKGVKNGKDEKMGRLGL